jgi:hypothetical protein
MRLEMHPGFHPLHAVAGANSWVHASCGLWRLERTCCVPAGFKSALKMYDPDPAVRQLQIWKFHLLPPQRPDLCTGAVAERSCRERLLGNAGLGSCHLPWALVTTSPVTLHVFLLFLAAQCGAPSGTPDTAHRCSYLTRW